MRIFLYIVAILLIYCGFLSLLVLAVCAMFAAGATMTGTGNGNVPVLQCLGVTFISFLLGAYLFVLAGRREVMPDGDMHQHIRKGCLALLGLGIGFLGLCIWIAMPFHSLGMIAIGLAVGAPIIIILWICGVFRRIANRR